MNDLFYHRLKELVESSGKSANQIERELGYPRNSLNNYKLGGEPSGTRLIGLSEYFNVSPKYLWDIIDEPMTVLQLIFFKLYSRREKRNVYNLSKMVF